VNAAVKKVVDERTKDGAFVFRDLSVEVTAARHAPP
jgi:hypothetical protein